MHRVLVLGGYGFFGSRICKALAVDSQIYLFISGRDGLKAKKLALELHLRQEQGIRIDAQNKKLADTLEELRIDTVIHTAGPFQGQNYDVAKSCIAAGANYIDLADGRDFVAGISQLDAEARERGILVTSGASSLPALSSAVVDRYVGKFSVIKSIRHGIASGARAPGLATMSGIFSYCGKPFLRLEAGQYVTTYGWLDMQRHHFPSAVGNRLLGSCDVPDLVLFPGRYSGVETVTFHAGFASNLGHLVVWTLSQLVRIKMLSSLTLFVKPLAKISQWMEGFVSDKGGMFVCLEGLDQNAQALKMTWYLLVAQNHGPYIPCGASIALVQKLARNIKLPSGAMPCVGLLSVEEYLASLDGFDVRELVP
ncbi:saccharopine dehydrogenase family protein [Undibacterium sp. SXout20W]|uniref:saccharopine dehydrogenase family protein n=1 Tax=Undibacterium sp. SXout20W TaxID=3413051 RepID=UPI003BF23312